jgi:putative SbcD/Mre11-related phosphoesterase
MRVHTDWLLTPERAAVHVPTATAVLADLHLGYDQVRRRGGDAIPDFGLDDTFASLSSLAARTAVRRLVIAGDLCESAGCGDTVAAFLDGLGRIGVELAGVVPGNHDRDLHARPAPVPLFPQGLELADWRIVHGDGPLPTGPVVCGHWHPCVRWGRGLAAPCFLIGRRRLVLPAFSADAAGVNVFGDRRWRPYRCCAVVGDKVLDFGEVGTLKAQSRNVRL